MKRVALYARVSSEEQTKRMSIKNQLGDAERWLARRDDVALVDTYADDGVSGTIELAMRPAGGRLLRDAAAGRFDGVLVWKLDRLGRDPAAIITMTALRDLFQRGVIVESITEAVDLTRPEGWFMATMLAGAAGLERSNLLVRSNAGQERKVREGYWMGGAVPYGFRLGPDDRLAINDATIPGTRYSEADVVRMMFRLLAVERLSCHKIADRLQSLGIPTAVHRDGERKRRGPVPKYGWQYAAVRRIVTSPLYKGEYHWGSGAGAQAKGRTPIVVEVPALVSVQEWGVAQEALALNMKFSSRNSRRQYLLRGLIRCGVCGLVYVGASNSNKRPNWYYKCSRYTKQRVGRCAGKTIYAQEIEDAVWADVERFIRNPGDTTAKLAARMRAEMAQADTLHAELRDVLGRLRGMGAERDAMLTLFRKGRIGEGDLDRQLDHIIGEERTLEERRDQLQALLRDADATTQRLTSVEGLLRELGRKLDGPEPPDFDTKRFLVEKLVAGVRVDTVAGADGKPEAEAHITYVFDPASERIASATRTRSFSNTLEVCYK